MRFLHNLVDGEGAASMIQPWKEDIGVGFVGGSEQVKVTCMPRPAKHPSAVITQGLIFFESGRIMSGYVFDNIASDVCKVVLRA